MKLPKRTWVLIACALIFLAPGLAQAGDSLRFGVMPFTSAKALVERFSGLRDYMRQTLGTDVMIETAPDFQAFKRRQASLAYDITLTPSHIAALTADHLDYRPLAKTEDMAVHIFVRKGSGFRSVDDLDGGSIALPDPLSIAALLAEEELADRQIEFGHTVSHNTALLLVAEGHADAAVSVYPFFEQLPDTARELLHPIANIGTAFAVISVAPGPGADYLETSLAEPLLHFHETPGGKSFGLELQPVSAADLDEFMRFSSKLMALMAAQEEE